MGYGPGGSYPPGRFKKQRHYARYASSKSAHFRAGDGPLSLALHESICFLLHPLPPPPWPLRVATTSGGGEWGLSPYPTRPADWRSAVGVRDRLSSFGR